MQPMPFLCLLAFCVAAAAQPAVLAEWTFDQPGQLHGWQPNGHLTEVAVRDGALHAAGTGADPFFTSPAIDITPNATQWLEIELSATGGRRSELFYSTTPDTPHGGFTPEQLVFWEQPADGEVRTVRVDPFWQNEARIIRLRLDITPGSTVAIRRVAILEAGGREPLTGVEFDGLDGWTQRADGLWLSPPLDVAVDDLPVVVLRLQAPAGRRARLYWATDAALGLQSQNVALRGAGRPHTYYLRPTSATWQGRLAALGVELSDEAADRAELLSLRLAARAEGPADLDVVYFGPADGHYRVGRPAEVICRLANRGYAPAPPPRARLTAPDGLRVEAVPLTTEPLPPGQSTTLRWRVEADRAGVYPLELIADAVGLPALNARTELAMLPPLVGVPQGAMPPPVRATTEYNIGSYYFPGWGRGESWSPVDEYAPWRRPLLGYYDEAQPEIADWQIKWAVEHGVSFFMVDWYWEQGSRSLEHWLQSAYAGAQYRDQIKWAIMWANHIPDQSHTPEDWRELVTYWLDTYLQTPEYLHLDGKPAVFIWNPAGLRRGVGGTEVAADLYAEAQTMAQAVGLAGINFVAMTSSGFGDGLQAVADEGYWGATHYHGWYDATARAADPRWFNFSLVAERAPLGWTEGAERSAAVGLNYLPVVDTGWDSRPWHGDTAMVIEGYTALAFEGLLREAKAWLDARGQKNLVLGPWNEWGEGSWLEPNIEHGFGLLDAIRYVFCEPGPHVDVVPADVGLGPYDFPWIHGYKATSWDFRELTDGGGWQALMQVTRPEVVGGALSFRSTGADPALTFMHAGFDAASFGQLRIRMRATAPAGTGDLGVLQLFWAQEAGRHTEPNSVKLPLIADGQMHDYVFDLAAQPGWQQQIRGFRLDPGHRSHVDFAIESIELVPTQG